MASERPNLLLICADQWRGDSLGVAGHPVVETPHLDALARSGTLFTQAYSACPSCIAARAALFTGLSPRRHGFVGYRDGVHWRYPVTLAGTLAAAGYHTQCIGKMHVFPERNLLGFHNVVLHDGYLHFALSQHRNHSLIDDYLPWLREKLGDPYVDHTDTGLGCNGYAVRPWLYDDRLHPTSWVTTQGIDFLRRRDPARPFFLMLSYHRPHPPLDPPRSFLERYLRKELPSLPMGDWVDHELPAHRGLDSPVPRDPEEIDLARRAYYAQLTHIDHEINRVLIALHEYGLLEDTAILFTSDHGDMLYDHNYIAKSLPYDGSARVPFILRPPGRGVWDEKPGQEIDAVVELRDVFPTLCDLAGVPIPEGLDGASVLPLLRGEERGWREYLHGEHAAGPRSNHWVTDGREKYVWFSQTGREQLFEIATDPQELRDLAPLRQDRVAYWRRKLMRELEGRPEGFVQEGKLVAGRPVSPALEHAGVGV